MPRCIVRPFVPYKLNGDILQAIVIVHIHVRVIAGYRRYLEVEGKRSKAFICEPRKHL